LFELNAVFHFVREVRYCFAPWNTHFHTASSSSRPEASYRHSTWRSTHCSWREPAPAHGLLASKASKPASGPRFTSLRNALRIFSILLDPARWDVTGTEVITRWSPPGRA
jgi:hypothetical protein